MTPAQVQAASSTVEDVVDQRPAVLVVENTHNVAGGRVWPLDELDAVVAVARAAGVGVHMDGARLMNAAVALGVPPAAIASRVDTVTLCLSKGLGCPLGAVLAGPADLMEIAWRQKFLFGGAMRQAGMIAAAALYALDNHVELLALDHERARRLAEGWHAEGVPVEIDRVETNFVQIDTSRLDIPRAEVLGLLRDAGVGMSPTYTPSHIRAVTHMDLDDADIDRALELVPAVLGYPCPRLSRSATELDRLLATAQSEQRMPSVSACVFRDGEVIWERVLGVADLADGRAATSDDVYRIGSITKTFTAVLVMQLVTAGRLELDAPHAHVPARGSGRTDDPDGAQPHDGRPARAAGRDLGVDGAAVARGADRGPRGRRARPATR